MENREHRGTEHEVKGAVKEGAGKVTGDERLETRGKLEKNAGKLERDLDNASDDLGRDRR